MHFYITRWFEVREPIDTLAARDRGAYFSEKIPIFGIKFRNFSDMKFQRFWRRSHLTQALKYSKARLHSNEGKGGKYTNFFNYAKTSEFLFRSYEIYSEIGFVDLKRLSSLKISNSTIYNYLNLALEYKIMEKKGRNIVFTDDFINHFEQWARNFYSYDL